MEDAYVFIDGAYLSLIAKHLFGDKPPAFDLAKFAETLAKLQGMCLKATFYYTASPYQSSKPTSQEARRRANYDKFVFRLKKLPDFFVREGRCPSIDGKFAQKGVDTLITIDLMRVPESNVAKNAILVLCDTDFVPILKELSSNKSVCTILYYFSDRIRNSRFSMSNHLRAVCDRCVLLDKSHFEAAILNKQNDL